MTTSTFKTIDTIKFQRYYYDDSYNKGEKVIYDDLLIKDTKANRNIIKKINDVINCDYDDDNGEYTNNDKSDILNELIAEFETLDEVRITETIEIEW